MPKPFLKWAGGKHRIRDKIVPHILDCNGSRFIEPFTGSLAIPLHVYDKFDSLVVADYNADLINIYEILKDGDPNEFLELVSGFFTEDTNDKDMYYHLRKEFNSTNDPLIRSALFIYLNRHGFNGMCRYNSSGGFNIPFGKYKKPLLPSNEILECSKILKENDFTLIQCSFELLFDEVTAGDVVYCDPPYIPIDATASFTSYTADGFTGEQQVQLADLARECQARGAHVLVSNHYLEDIIPELYHGAELITFPVQRFIAAKKENSKAVEEVLAIFHPE